MDVAACWRGGGGAPALEAEAGWSLTRDGLAEAVGVTAARLAGTGVGPGSVVVVALPSRPDLVVAVLALVELGALVVPLDTVRWPRELRAAVELAHPDMVVAAEDVASGLDDLAPTLAVAPPAGPGPAVGPAARARAAEPDDQRGAPGGIACATAGLWGEPQLFTFSRAQLSGWLRPADAAGTGPTDGPPREPADGGDHGEHVVVATGVAQAAGLRTTLQTLAAGGTVRLVERWLARRLLEGLERRPPARLVASGPQLNGLAATVADRGPGRARVAVLDVSGGRFFPRSATTLGRGLDALVVPRYTLTEAGGWATVGAPRAAADHDPLDVGRPATGVHVALDRLPAGPGAEEATLAGLDHLGAVSVSGRATATGQLGPPGAGRRTGAAGAVADVGSETGPVWEAGDLGRWRPDGGLELVGRLGDRFRCRGSEVHPVLVELALARHPGVADVAVVPRPHPELGWLPVAVTVPTDPSRPPFLADLHPLLDHLPPGARPAAQAVVDRLPLTPGGLLHRRMLAYDEVGR